MQVKTVRELVLWHGKTAISPSCVRMNEVVSKRTLVKQIG